MILDDFRKALGQLGDPRFRRVLLLGLGLTIALLVALSIAAGWLVGWLVPDTLSLPWIGQVGFLDPLASGLSVVAGVSLTVRLHPGVCLSWWWVRHTVTRFPALVMPPSAQEVTWSRSRWRAGWSQSGATSVRNHYRLSTMLFGDPLEVRGCGQRLGRHPRARSMRERVSSPCPPAGPGSGAGWATRLYGPCRALALPLWPCPDQTRPGLAPTLSTAAE